MSTDPLAEWTLERDVWVNLHGRHANRLRVSDGSYFWVGAPAADQFERAKAITAAWAERGDDDPYDYLLTMARQGCFCEGNRKPCERHDAYADGLEAGLAQRPAPPADDLPEGVHRIDADTLVARGTEARGERLADAIAAEDGAA